MEAAPHCSSDEASVAAPRLLVMFLMNSPCRTRKRAPPEALSDEDADGIFAAAAEADAAAAEGELEGDGRRRAVRGDLQDAIVEAINTMEAEGMPQEEIMAEVMAETGLTEEDMVKPSSRACRSRDCRMRTSKSWRTKSTRCRLKASPLKIWRPSCRVK